MNTTFPFISIVMLLFLVLVTIVNFSNALNRKILLGERTNRRHSDNLLPSDVKNNQSFINKTNKSTEKSHLVNMQNENDNFMRINSSGRRKQRTLGQSTSDFIPGAGQERILECYLQEERPPNEQVVNVLEEYGLNRKYNESVLSKLRFSFITLPAGERQYFTIEERTGIIRTTTKIDREELCLRMDFCFVKFDVAVQPIEYFQIIKVKVEVLDINDNSPRFPKRTLQYNLSEDAEPGTSFLIPSADDLDSTRNGVVDYELMPASDVFELTKKDLADGSTQLRLLLRQRVDRELVSSYQFNVLALDGGDPVRSGLLLVNISLTDVNDNSPVFESTTHEIKVKEDLRPGSIVFRVRAYDRDIGLNGELVYYFTKDTQRDYGRTFSIRPDTGIISTISELDHEERDNYLLYIVVSDRGESVTLTAQMTLNIKVEDINDNAPSIHINVMPASHPPSTSSIKQPSYLSHSSQGPLIPEVKEESEVDTFVAHLSVEDKDGDRNGKFYCYITNSNLFELRQLYSSEFKVVTRVTFDRERQDKQEFSVTCQDNGLPSLTTVLPVTVRIVDINDNTPQFLRESYEVTVSENNPIGHSIVRVTATDKDTGRNGEVRYRISEEQTARYLTVDPMTGILSSKAILDHEISSRHVFSVIAHDLGSEGERSSTAQIFVTVVDLDDESAEFTSNSYTFSVNENLPPATEVGVVKAIDKDTAVHGSVTYRIIYPPMIESDPGQLSLPLSIHRSSGRITTIQTLDREIQALYKFKVIASSTVHGQETTSTCDVIIHVSDVNDHQPVFEYPSANTDRVLASVLTPRGFVIAKARASDKDTGVNAELSYSIKYETASQRAFQIDRRSGDIKVVQDLLELKEEEITLTITAQDGGVPSFTAVSDLTIEIRKDLPAPPNSRMMALLASEDLAVILALTLAAILVTISIVIAIIIYARRRRNVKRFTGLCAGSEYETEPMRGQAVALDWGGGLTNGHINIKEGDKYSLALGCGELSEDEPDSIAGEARRATISKLHQLSEDIPEECLNHQIEEKPLNRPVVGFIKDQLKKVSPNSDSNSDSGRGPSSEDGDLVSRQLIGHNDGDLISRQLIGHNDVTSEAQVRVIARQSSSEYLKMRLNGDICFNNSSQGSTRTDSTHSILSSFRHSNHPTSHHPGFNASYLSLEDVRPRIGPSCRGGASIPQPNHDVRAGAMPLYTQTLDHCRTGHRWGGGPAPDPRSSRQDSVYGTMRYSNPRENMTSLNLLSRDAITSSVKPTRDELMWSHLVPLTVELGMDDVNTNY